MKFKKLLCAFLAMLFVAQMMSIPASARGKMKEYEGQYLLSVNTNLKKKNGIELDFGEAVKQESENNTSSSADIDIPHDAVRDDLVLLPEDEEDENFIISTRGATEYKLGDKKEVKDWNDNKTTVECVYLGTSVTVWLDRDYSVTENACIEYGKKLDEIFPKELELYGDCRIDPDGDGRIAVFVHDVDNEGSVVGFFSTNEMVNYGRIGTHPVFYRTLQQGVDSFHTDATSISTAVHEYGHYIYACYKYSGRIRNLKFDSTLTEVLSNISEYLLNNDSARAYSLGYLTKDSTQFMTGDYYSVYPMGFAFGNFLRLRYAANNNETTGQYPGSSFFKKLLETTAAGNKDIITTAADILYPQVKKSDDRVKALFIEFWKFVITKKLSVDYDLSGETWLKKYDIEDMFLNESEKTTLSPGMAKLTLIDYDGGRIKAKSDSADVHFETVTAPGYFIFIDGEKDGYTEEETYVYLTGKKYSSVTGFIDADTNEPFTGTRIKPTKNTHLLRACEEPTNAVIGSRNNAVKAKECFKIQVPESGWYSSNQGLYKADDKDFEDDELYNFSSTNNYYLRADETYYSNVSKGGYLLVNKVAAHYKLGLHFPKCEAGEYLEYDGGTQYRIPSDLKYDLNNIHLELLGWAYEQNAENADFGPQATVTLTKDTDLYAVYNKINSLKPGRNKVTDYLYKDKTYSETEYECYFVAPDDGTYVFTATGFTFVTAYEHGQNSKTEGNTVTCSLFKNEEITLCWNDYEQPEGTVMKAENEWVIDVDKESNGVTCTLTLYVDSTEAQYFTLNGTVKDGKISYIIPAFSPLCLEEPDSDFAGWAYVKQDDDEPYIVCKAGETYETYCKDEVLYAVYSDHKTDDGTTWFKIIKVLRLTGSMFVVVFKMLINEIRYKIAIR